MRSARLVGIWVALALGVAPTAWGGEPRLEGGHACPDAPGFTCSTLAVPLDHSGAVAGNAPPAGRGIDERRGAARDPALPRGRAGSAGRAVGRPPRRAARGAVTDDYRLVVIDQRGTGAGALDCPALQRAMGSSDLSRRLPRQSVRAGRRLGRSAASSAPTTSSPTSTCSAGRSAPSAGRSTASRTGPSSPSATRSPTRGTWPARARLGRAALRRRRLGTTADARGRRVLGDVCGRACVADLAAVIRARHNGPGCSTG